MSSENEAIKQFYKQFSTLNIKNKKHLKNELLYQLLKNPPPEKNQPRMKKYQEGTHQADVLYMPDDDGYSYALTVVDCSSRLTDARPLKTRDAQTVLNAIKDIYKGKILKQPNILQVDNGSEFKSVFKSYFEKQNVIIMTAQTGRHRQIALAEARNGAISKPLLTRMVAEELVTGEQSNDWVKFLPDVIKMLNDQQKLLRFYYY